MQVLPIAATPTELKVCKQFILDKVQLCLEKSNDTHQFAYMKAQSTLAAVGFLAHTITKSLNFVLKVYIVIFLDLSSAFYTIPACKTLAGFQA